jgi:RecA/RadA recombinase
MINIQSADSAIDLDEESEIPGPPLIAPMNDDKIRRPADNLSSFMVDMSSVVNNESIVIMLNNDSMAQRSIYDKELDALGGASGG